MNPVTKYLGLLVLVLGISFYLISLWPMYKRWGIIQRRAVLIRMIVAIFALSLVSIANLVGTSDWGKQISAAFLVVTAAQVFCWALGMRLEILGSKSDLDEG